MEYFRGRTADHLGEFIPDWGVESTQADTTSVKTYPSVQKNYNHPKYTSLRGLRSRFTESMPSTGNFDAEAAYDLWLNNYQVEVMMWFDNHKQTPAGSVIAKIHIYGKKFAVWQSGHDMYSFVLSGTQKTERQGPSFQRLALAGKPRLPEPLRHADTGKLRLGDRFHRRSAHGLHADAIFFVNRLEALTSSSALLWRCRVHCHPRRPRW